MTSNIRNIINRVGGRVALLALICLVLNFIYTRFFWIDDLEQYAPMLSELISVKDSAEVLYFGESSNFSTHPDDSLKEPISKFISYHFPDSRFATINNSAYHAGLYLQLIRQIDKGSKVQMVIVTLNMRTFDQAAINSKLESALQKSNTMYHPRPPLMNRFLMSLNFYDNRDSMQRDLQTWKSWTYDTLKSDDPKIKFDPNTIRRWCETIKFPDSNGIENMPLRLMADHNIKAFAFQINDQNPRVRDFDEIVRVCRDKNLRLVLNLMAENVEYADSFVGENLVWLMRQNRNYLINRYQSGNVLVVDNLESVHGKHYRDQDWTTEHYDQIGRQIIAKNVTDSIIRRKWLNGSTY
ncbi:MAG: hypothetical protein GC181_14720 [Bacteroidetes bacterium]|nr:hypothetical protein [Bacteroidota bacterium]